MALAIAAMIAEVATCFPASMDPLAPYQTYQSLKMLASLRRRKMQVLHAKLLFGVHRSQPFLQYSSSLLSIVSPDINTESTNAVFGFR